MPDHLSGVRAGGNSTITVDPILTELARGYVNADFVGDHLFPKFGTETESLQVPTYGMEALAIRETRRALRAKSNRSELQGFGLQPFKLQEHDHEFILDYREVEEAKKSPFIPTDLEQHAAEVNEQVILLGREKEQADLAQNPSSYPTSNAETLGSGDKFDDPTSDPIEILNDAIRTVSKRTQQQPNVMILGEDVWFALKKHPKILERIKYAQVGVLSYELLATILDFKPGGIHLGKSVYVNVADLSKNGDDSDIEPVAIWGSNVVIAYVEPKPKSKYSMGFGLTFEKNNSKLVDSYHPENNQKLLAVRNTSIYRAHTTNPSAGFLLKDVLTA